MLLGSILVFWAAKAGLIQANEAIEGA